jgi:hypothetical protein
MDCRVAMLWERSPRLSNFKTKILGIRKSTQFSNEVVETLGITPSSLHVKTKAWTSS